MTAPITGLSHVQLEVTDVAVSERWYTTVFGMDRLTAADDGSYAALRHRPSGVVIVLSRRTDGATTLGPPLDHLAFAVPDRQTLDGWADHLTDAGIAHPGVVMEGVNHSLQLRDPDGIEIELAAPPGRP